jgi:hypothetical protein
MGDDSIEYYELRVADWGCCGWSPADSAAIQGGCCRAGCPTERAGSTVPPGTMRALVGLAGVLLGYNSREAGAPRAIRRKRPVKATVCAALHSFAQLIAASPQKKFFCVVRLERYEITDRVVARSGSGMSKATGHSRDQSLLQCTSRPETNSKFPEKESEMGLVWAHSVAWRWGLTARMKQNEAGGFPLPESGLSVILKRIS